MDKSCGSKPGMITLAHILTELDYFHFEHILSHAHWVKYTVTTTVNNLPQLTCPGNFVQATKS